MAEKKISERITIIENESSTVIQITQNVEKWKKYALIAWVVCWLFCGLIFVIELAKTEDPNQQLYFGVLLGGWFFILYRILRVTFWRFIGKEIITFQNGVLSIQNAFGKYGKTKDFNMPQIPAIKEIKNPKYAFFQFMDKSFWVIGDNKFEFKYVKGTFQFGKQLNAKEVGSMKRIVEKTFRKYRGK